VWRRVWHFIVDLVDGILAGMLYGHQGGFGVYSGSAEAQNARKLRRWAAGGSGSATRSEQPRQRTESAAAFDVRMRRFRRETTAPRDDRP
jgi:hypothetical protein